MRSLLAACGTAVCSCACCSCCSFAHQKCKSSTSQKFSMPVLARSRFPLNHPHERPGRDLAETPPFVPCGPKKGAKNHILAKRRAAAPKYAQSSAAAGGGKGNALCGAVHLYYRYGSLRGAWAKAQVAAVGNTLACGHRHRIRGCTTANTVQRARRRHWQDPANVAVGRLNSLAGAEQRRH